MTYKEKFKDPRWQKKRLKILERDDWTCQCCGDKESTLHVHHRYYKTGLDPWDYPDISLITLCEECHEEESLLRPNLEQNLLQACKSKFLISQVESLGIAIHCMPTKYVMNIIMDAFCWALEDSKMQEKIIKAHMHLKRKRKRKRKRKNEIKIRDPRSSFIL